MVVVPYEIWLHITSYLSKNEVWGLRFLSPMLYDIAMDSRFRSIDFSVTFRKSATRYIGNFIRFREPDIAKRVRHISYFNHASTIFPEKRKIKKTVKNRFQTMFAKSAPTYADMVETMESLTNVISLNLRFLLFDEKNYFEDCLPLVHANFRACYSQLQSLILFFPLTHFPLIILPDLLLPCLASLTITFFGPGTDSEQVLFPNVAQTTISPFINRHRHTLTSVNFQTISGTAQPLDVSSLYHGLDHIASLKTAIIGLTALTQSASIARFLQMHRETLRNIEIDLMDRPYTLVDNVFRFITEDFPNLERFSVRCLGFRLNPTSAQTLDITTDFMKKCSSSLVSLDIFGGVYDMQTLRELFNPRGIQEVTFAKLTTLHMSILTLTPAILDFFASQLPNLHVLDLFARSLKCRESLPDVVNDSYEFSLEMARRNYSSWKLEHLTLLCERFRGNYSGSMTIARAIPSLKTINGVKLAKPLETSPPT